MQNRKYYKTEEGMAALRSKLKSIIGEINSLINESNASRPNVIEEGGDTGGRVFNDTLHHLKNKKDRMEEEVRSSETFANTPEIRRAAVRIGTCIVTEECVCNGNGKALGETEVRIKHIVGWREYYQKPPLVIGLPYITEVGEMFMGCTEGVTIISQPKKGKATKFLIKKLCADVDEALAYIKESKLVAA